MLNPMTHGGAVTALRRSDTIRERDSLLVSPQQTGWVVRGGHLPRVHRFPTKEQAIGFARHWARDHRPSVVRLEIEPGEVAGEWEYEAYPRPEPSGTAPG